MIAQAGKTGLLLLAIGLSACSDPNNVILQGVRLDARTGAPATDTQSAQANRSAAISLGNQVSRASWTHAGGSASHASGHNAFTAGTPVVAWTAPIGKGNTRKLRIASAPVAGNGVIATYDAGATVSVVSASTGGLIWSADLTPSTENRGDASSGSLALSGDTLLAASAYGEVVAFDLTSGAVKWRQRLDAAGASGLTIHKGLAYVVGGDSQLWAIDLVTGLVKWQVSGSETTASRVGAAAPAVNDRLAVVPFASGDILGVFRKGGTQLWSASLAGQRAGVVYANVSDITSDPVILGNTVYMGNQAGRYAAYDMETGARRWTADEGAYSPASVIGGSVFLISDRGQLVRLSAQDGSVIWRQQLPYFTTDKIRKRKDVFAHYGPVAAGGKLWVASSDKILRGFSPTNGALSTQIALPAGAASDPIVVGGVMYVLLENGTLAAVK
ncbi:outer membrane protein assembly factor BamB [Pacificibacter maritimus]|uniref:Outer membrane protein assembly factor BamB n=1 Tax=Pacificibacter maritimus TaxID=762213 RepID=A0A3N4UMG5_9RHOB|nr:PQQ-binding-like beta-propeller repeat protein [Pacificibacter maritimus]RPE71653.1 outer membrane protein assembly factor BamB [Pacificibacter maritimus]